ncbi:glycosyltransferase family 4 protein [Haloplanus litoreus]|uniref:Glycosyltransferase family 4 protein n=1 Tax=Haloplanus litoreus TaxID=767515 RepID=A0ABD6A328_9EURY
MHTTSDVETHVASFYDSPSEEVDPDVAEFDVPTTRLGGGSRFDLGAYRRLRALLDEFDIVHTHHNFVGSVGRLVAATTETKVVNTEHNDHNGFTHLQNIVNVPTLPLSDCIVGNSQATLDSFQWYERPFVHGVETRVIYNGVDLDRIDAQESTERFGDRPLVVTVGSLIEQKDQAVLVRAMEPVVRDCPEATLVIVGSGPLRNQLERTAQKVGVEANVIFTGYVPTREEVYRIVKSADVFAMSSDYEGFCVAAVEGMACGKPVVASDIDVFREVINEGGAFAERGNPNSFASHIIELLTDAGRRSKLGARARQRAETEFPLERAVERHQELYLDVMDE